MLKGHFTTKPKRMQQEPRPVVLIETGAMVRKLFFVSLFLFVLTPLAATGMSAEPQADTLEITPAFNDAWYNPNTAGQGFFITVLPQANVVFLSWFTYDTDQANDIGEAHLGEPDHRWLTAQGPIEGDSAELTVYITSGGRFDSSDAVQNRPDGTILLSFDGCNSGTVSYNIPSIERQGSIPIERVVPDNAAACEEQSPSDLPESYTQASRNKRPSTMASDVPIGPSLNDAWYNPDTAGQGYFITVLPETGIVFLAWFTFDTDQADNVGSADFGEANHRWVTAQGPINGNGADLTVYKTSGGQFDASTEVQNTESGTIRLEFASCNSATVTYNFPAIERQGTVPIQRVVPDNVGLCEAMIDNEDPYPEITAYRKELERLGILDDLDAVVAYGANLELSLYNLDAILGAEPGSTMRYAHDNGLWQGSGQNRIEEFALNFENVVSVSADPSEVKYPDDYQAVPSDIDVEDPYCDLEPEQIVIPEEFLGKYPLPEIVVTEASEPFRKFAYLKDIWERYNANFIQTCFGDARDAINVTLKRLKQANIDTLVLFPFTTVDTSQTEWRIQTEANMPDEDLAWIAQAASSMGIDVFWRHQVQYACEGVRDGEGVPCFIPESTIENVLKTYDAMEPYLKERGAFLESLGVAGVSLVGDFWNDPGEVLSDEQYIERTEALIKALKTNFSGEILHDLKPPLMSAPEIKALVDSWEFVVFYDEVVPLEDNLSVEAVVPFIRNQIEYYQNIADGNLIVLPAVASRGNFLSDLRMYVEETFCTDETDSIFQEPGNCFQEEIPTDFSLQAILYQAVLEAAFSTPGHSPAGIAVDYWVTDGILPAYPWTFPNISYTIRNKPAEQIVLKWFEQP